MAGGRQTAEEGEGERGAREGCGRLVWCGLAEWWGRRGEGRERERGRPEGCGHLVWYEAGEYLWGKKKREKGRRKEGGGEREGEGGGGERDDDGRPWTAIARDDRPEDVPISLQRFLGEAECL